MMANQQRQASAGICCAYYNMYLANINLVLELASSSPRCGKDGCSVAIWIGINDVNRLQKTCDSHTIIT